jgi:hypothetical protein
LKFTVLVQYIVTYWDVFAKHVLSVLYLKNFNLKFSTVSAYYLWKGQLNMSGENETDVSFII